MDTQGTEAVELVLVVEPQGSGFKGFLRYLALGCIWPLCWNCVFRVTSL